MVFVMTPKWNNVILQGLSGLGLVGYNTVKTLVEAYDAEVYKDYAEFFPNITVIENARLENQCVRIYQKEIQPKRQFRFINGGQPRSEELSSLFLQKIIADIQELQKGSKIDLFLSFGAYITKTISHEDLQEHMTIPKDELAEKILDAEMKKERNIYIATAGPLFFDDFIKDLESDKTITKEPGGYITGLNGVIPAVIGERLKVPAATVMIETTGAGSDIRSPSDFPLLAQFLGLLATKRAVIFLEKTFDLKINLESKIDTILEELKSNAKQEIIALFEKDHGIDRSRTSDFRNDKMYT